MPHPTQIILLSRKDNRLAFRKTKVSHCFRYEKRELWYKFEGKTYHGFDAPALAKQLVSAGISDGTVAWQANYSAALQRCESLHALALLTCGVVSLRDCRLTSSMLTENETKLRPDIVRYFQEISPKSRFLNIRSYRFGVGQIRAHKAVHLVADLAHEADELALAMLR